MEEGAYYKVEDRWYQFLGVEAGIVMHKIMPEGWQPSNGDVVDGGVEGSNPALDRWARE